MSRRPLILLATTLAVAGAAVSGAVGSSGHSQPRAVAAAGDNLTLTKVEIDHSNEHLYSPTDKWTVSKTSATWDTQNWTGQYKWTIPSSIPPRGANASLQATAKSKHGRFSAVEVIRGTVPTEDGQQAGVNALAEPGETKTATLNFKLVPGSYAPGSEIVVQVDVQDGPKINFHYEVAAPLCPARTARTAATPAESDGCTPKFGTEIAYKAPKPGKVMEVVSPPVPPFLYDTSLSVRMADTAPGKLEGVLAEPPRRWTKADKIAYYLGCLEWGEVLLAKYHYDRKWEDDGGEFIERAKHLNRVLIIACVTLLERELAKAQPANAAASGCAVAVDPLPKVGTNPSKRSRKRLSRHTHRRLRPTCSRSSSGAITLHLHARKSSGSLRELLGRRVRVGIGRTAKGRDGSNPRLVLRWKKR